MDKHFETGNDLASTDYILLVVDGQHTDLADEIPVLGRNAFLREEFLESKKSALLLTAMLNNASRAVKGINSIIELSPEDEKETAAMLKDKALKPALKAQARIFVEELRQDASAMAFHDDLVENGRHADLDLGDMNDVDHAPEPVADNAIEPGKVNIRTFLYAAERFTVQNFGKNALKNVPTHGL